MKVDAGLETVPTGAGVFCTILLSFILLLFTAQKTEILITKSSVDTLSSTNVGYYDDDYVFDHTKGLFVAVAFTGWGDYEIMLPPSIGELVFYAEEWGLDENEKKYYNVTRLPTHTCTVEELGLVESDYMIS